MRLQNAGVPVTFAIADYQVIADREQVRALVADYLAAGAGSPADGDLPALGRPSALLLSYPGSTGRPTASAAKGLSFWSGRISCRTWNWPG